MQTFHHTVDFEQYRVGDKFNEFLTPGSSNPGTIIQDGAHKALYWTGPTWLSYIRAWADLAVTGGVVTVRETFRLTNERALNVVNLLTYNTRGWGHATACVHNGSVRVQVFANYEDALRWANPLATVDVGSWDKADHDWTVSLTKDHVTIDWDGANIINVDIPAKFQGNIIDSLRARCQYCVLSAHEVTCNE